MPYKLATLAAFLVFTAALPLSAALPLHADVLGTATAILADRSLYRAVGLRLRELRIGDKVVRDVTAAVAPGTSYPLLGQSFLGKFGSVTFDNQKGVLILSDNSSTNVTQSAATVSVVPSSPSSQATASPSIWGYDPFAYDAGRRDYGFSPNQYSPTPGYNTLGCRDPYYQRYYYDC